MTTRRRRAIRKDAGASGLHTHPGGWAREKNRRQNKDCRRFARARRKAGAHPTGLRARGFSAEDILLLDPLEPDIDNDGAADPGHRDFYLHSAATDLATAFQRAAAGLQAGQRFIFYLHGHGAPDALKLNRETALGAGELRAHLDSLPAGSEQVVILDTCYSGSLLDDLAAPGRIVVTAADADEAAWSVEPDGFFAQLFSGLRRGLSLYEAFQHGSRALDSPVFRHQRPHLDDDGDGFFSSQDGLRAQSVYFGGQGVRGDDPPDIVRVHSPLSLDQARGVLWLETVELPEQLRQVRATLMPPQGQIPVYAGETTATGMLKTLEMGYNPVQARWEAVFDGFYQGGEWRVYYQAESRDGLFSDTIPGAVIAPGLEAAVDVSLNLPGYATGDRFRLDVGVSGTRRADLYMALVFPRGFFMTLTYPAQFNLPGTLQAYMADIDLAATPPYGVLDFPVPAGLAPGIYAACGVLVPVAQTPALDGSNWLHFECETFGMEG